MTVITLLNFILLDKESWVEIIITAVLIPLLLISFQRLGIFFNQIRPSKLIFKDLWKKEHNIYLFCSQLHNTDEQYCIIKEPKYIINYPSPMPNDAHRTQCVKRQNIDPVCPEADVECMLDIHNILGMIGKQENIHYADMIKHWEQLINPIISIGFNPKTNSLQGNCQPIYYKLNSDGVISANDFDFDYSNSIFYPNDAGIIQKSYIKDSKTPVFILAGGGTMGTSAAGYVLKQNYINIGKLYRSRPFCVFFNVKIDHGRSSAVIDKIYPKPSKLYLYTYLRFSKKGYFSY